MIIWQKAAANETKLNQVAMDLTAETSSKSSAIQKEKKLHRMHHDYIIDLIFRCPSLDEIDFFSTLHLHPASHIID